jgi:hypothetical protein
MRKVTLAIAGGIAATVVAAVLAAPVAQATPGCTNDTGTKTCSTSGPHNDKFTTTFEVKGSPNSSHPKENTTVTNPGDQQPKGLQP